MYVDYQPPKGVEKTEAKIVEKTETKEEKQNGSVFIQSSHIKYTCILHVCVLYHMFIACTYIPVHTQTHVLTHAHTHRVTHTHTHKCVHTRSMCMHVNTHIRTSVRTYTILSPRMLPYIAEITVPPCMHMYYNGSCYHVFL